MSQKKYTHKNNQQLKKSISSLDFSLFFRQLSALITAGIPILQGLNILKQNQSNKTLEYLLMIIEKNLEAGNTLSDCVSKFPRYFDKLTCHLIQIGELSGTLPSSLNRIAIHKENILVIKNKMKQALFYPAIILITALIVSVIMLTVVIPRFAELFTSMHATLPLFTLTIIHLSEFIRHYYWTAFFPIFAIILLIYYAKRSKFFRYRLESILFRMPSLGSLYMKIILSRFCRTLATTFHAGIPIDQSLKIIAHATASDLYAHSILKLRLAITKGQQLHQSMQRQWLFPDLLVQMIKIGEETGTLEKMLDKITNIYEADLDHWLTMCSHILEPLIITILGVLIGGLVIAMYLPLFKLGTVM